MFIYFNIFSIFEMNLNKRIILVGNGEFEISCLNVK